MVVLIRHACTTDDLCNKYSDQDSVIDLVPQKQGLLRRLRAELRGFVSSYGVDRVHCSNTLRGLQTAEMISKQATLSIIQSELLRNIHRPEWYGLSEAEIENRHRAQHARWYRDPMKVRFTGGETLSDVEARIRQFLLELKSTSVVISHTVPLQVILCLYLGLSLDRIWTFWPDHLTFCVVRPGILLAFNATQLSRLPELIQPSAT